MTRKVSVPSKKTAAQKRKARQSNIEVNKLVDGNKLLQLQFTTLTWDDNVTKDPLLTSFRREVNRMKDA
eukprot:CAMPEP_0197857970 /NCGR_PEP_ID=MMETSP1438-20131217/31437_1 /TAXON_ID=1461541 /ORGANISM="Pterosperma sp., Strain CCMP1384" /LENGTH=68 /DNA_ID=CAMNT_0043473983 /DNA_START=12 /DNA_END=214 /DNA_ORIENTATION=+